MKRHQAVTIDEEVHYIKLASYLNSFVFLLWSLSGLFELTLHDSKSKFVAVPECLILWNCCTYKKKNSYGRLCLARGVKQGLKQTGVRPGMTACSVLYLATGWEVRGSNPGGGEIFCAHSGRPRAPPSPLYNGYRVFPRGKAGGNCDDHSPPSSAEDANGLELYLRLPSVSK